MSGRRDHNYCFLTNILPSPSSAIAQAGSALRCWALCPNSTAGNLYLLCPSLSNYLFRRCGVGWICMDFSVEEEKNI